MSFFRHLYQISSDPIFKNSPWAAKLLILIIDKSGGDYREFPTTLKDLACDIINTNSFQGAKPSTKTISRLLRKFDELEIIGVEVSTSVTIINLLNHKDIYIDEMATTSDKDNVSDSQNDIKRKQLNALQLFNSSLTPSVHKVEEIDGNRNIRPIYNTLSLSLNLKEKKKKEKGEKKETETDHKNPENLLGKMFEKEEYAEMVFMTTKEYEELRNLFGEQVRKDFIEKLSFWMCSNKANAKKVTSAYHTIRRWLNNDGMLTMEQAKEKRKNSF